MEKWASCWTVLQNKLTDQWSKSQQVTPPKSYKTHSAMPRLNIKLVFFQNGKSRLKYMLIANEGLYQVYGFHE